MSNQLILTHTKSRGARALKIVLVFIFPSFLPSTNLINEHYEELSVCSVVFACCCCSFCVPDHPLMIVNFHLLFLLSNSFAIYWSGKYPLFFFLFFFYPPSMGMLGSAWCKMTHTGEKVDLFSIPLNTVSEVWRLPSACYGYVKYLLQARKLHSNFGLCKSECVIQSKHELRHMKLGQIWNGWSTANIPWGNNLYMTAPSLWVSVCSVVTVTLKPGFTC